MQQECVRALNSSEKKKKIRQKAKEIPHPKHATKPTPPLKPKIKPTPPPEPGIHYVKKPISEEPGEG
jgi:hypothetical protein